MTGFVVPTIVFSHANSFPAGTYRSLFAVWREAGYTVHAIEKYGHDPKYPVTGNWPHLRAQLIDFIEPRADEPVFLVGHSLGGFLSLMVASARPDLTCGVVMLDSPLIAGWKARVLQFAKASGLVGRFSPGRVSKRRRDAWQSAPAAYEHFAVKAAFARWAPGLLRDYIETGTEAHGAAHRLSFRRDIETEIYNTLPHHLGRMVRRQPPRCPVAFVRGTESQEVRRVGLRATERLTHGNVTAIEGTHLFPLERPVQTAAVVIRLLDAMGRTGPTRCL